MSPWFIIPSDLFSDPRLCSLAFEDQRHFIALLAIKADGTLDRINADPIDSLIAQRLGIDEKNIGSVKSRLMNAGLILNSWAPVDWDRFKPLHSGRPYGVAWQVTRKLVFFRDDYTCQYCGNRPKRPECDHILPVSKGGTHDYHNLITSCRKCNRSKRDKLIKLNF